MHVIFHSLFLSFVLFYTFKKRFNLKKLFFPFSVVHQQQLLTAEIIIRSSHIKNLRRHNTFIFLEENEQNCVWPRMNFHFFHGQLLSLPCKSKKEKNKSMSAFHSQSKARGQIFLCRSFHS